VHDRGALKEIREAIVSTRFQDELLSSPWS
jgi:hypothetical protein